MTITHLVATFEIVNGIPTFRGVAIYDDHISPPKDPSHWTFQIGTARGDTPQAAHAGIRKILDSPNGEWLRNLLDSHEYLAFGYTVMGRDAEAAGDFAEASRWYEKSLAAHPGWKSALRLAQTSFKEKKWQKCLEAYQAYLANREYAHLADTFPENEDAILILVASAYDKLGMTGEAHKVCQLLLNTYPNNQTVTDLCETILGLRCSEEKIL